ncbi:MAG: right-handed parallel beta-helix repeat-containing protein, partial [Planctomycetota bacterium]
EGGGLWNSSSGTMTVENVVFNGNAANGSGADNGGGGLFNDGGTCSVADSTFRLNRADQGSGSGGAIFNVGGDFSASWCRVLDNWSNRAGGGIEIVAGSTELFNCEFSRNATGAVPGNGGALHVTGAAEVFVELCDVRDNTAAAEGGGLWNSSSGQLTVSNCEIEANSAAGDAADQGGGGLFNDGGTLRVFGGQLHANRATGASGSGGGVLNDLGTLELTSVTVTANTAVRAGGGVEANVGTTTLLRTRLDGNSTGSNPGNGGGLHLTGPGTVGVERCAVTRNFAANEGGGLWNSSSGLMTVTLSRITDNESPDGPNLFNDRGNLVVDGTPIPPAN